MEEKQKVKTCCNFGKCPCCECCICICTKKLKKLLSPEARKILIKELS